MAIQSNNQNKNQSPNLGDLDSNNLDAAIAQYMGGGAEDYKKQLENMRARREILAEIEREKAVQRWSGQLTAPEKEKLRLLNLYYGLDPNQEHIILMGDKIYVTVKALQHIKNTNPEYAEIRIFNRPLNKEERENFTHPKKGPVAIGFCAEIYRGEIKVGNSYGVVYNDELNASKPTATHTWQMAETRAEGRALRKVIAVIGGCDVYDSETKEIIRDITPAEPARAEITPAPAQPVKPEPTVPFEPEPDNGEAATPSQLKAITNLAPKKFEDPDVYEKFVLDRYGCGVEGLTQTQAAELIKTLQEKG